jgi:8-oxo-dGTP pyrophosphatase MutT (NUDIX family)
MIEVSVIWLVLPSGDVVLQRRDKKTNVSPGLLGLFGGHIEAGETPEVAIKRELSEETSLSIPDLNISWVASAELPHPNDSTVMRRLHFYRALIDSDDFNVFEGEGSETYSVAELKGRQDLASSVAYVINHMEELGLSRLA